MAPLMHFRFILLNITIAFRIAPFCWWTTKLTASCEGAKPQIEELNPDAAPF